MPLEISRDIDSGLVEDVFEETPPMSTYLVAFIVSDFEALSVVDRISYSIWAREDAVEQAAYSLSISPRIIQFFENFTQIDFEIGKMDQAALPDFSAGAMENWGLVTYRERLLLFKEDTSTTSNKQNIATVIAHEFAHQWFGDLVSPAWWDYLWLNEGFATYFEYFATLEVEPDWRLDHQFVVNAHQNALVADSSATTHPITTSVFSPRQISSIFDTISYDKAGSIIRTAEHFLTHDTFQNGLRNYLKERTHQSATADDLFRHLHNQADENGVFTDAELNTITILESWTTQAGYPYITVQRTDDGIHISQKRFINTGETEDPTTWWVPITYTKKNAIDFTTTKPTAWLKNVAEDDIVTELAEDEWIILNIQETAFYRVLYDEANYQLLIDYLRSEEYSGIHPLNRAQLLDDSLNLARAGLLSYSTALEITTYLAKESDFIPWISYFRALTFLNTRFSGTEDFEIFKSYVLQLIENLYETVGFEIPEVDEHLTKLIRVTALTWACNFNHEQCLASASSLFRSWMDDAEGVNTISPDLRSVVYCSALSNGGEDEWKFLWNQYLSSKVATDQVLILSALGCTRNSTRLNDYLESSITEGSGIRMQDSQTVFSSVYSRAEGVDVALDFLTQNFVQIQQYYTSMNALGNIISGIASRLTTNEQLDRLREFVNENQADLGPAQSAATAALATVEANLAWFNKYREGISAWLDENTTTTPTTTSTTTPTTTSNTTDTTTSTAPDTTTSNTTDTTPDTSSATPTATGTPTGTTEETSTTDAACSLSFNPIVCVIILIGSLVVKY